MSSNQTRQYRAAAAAGTEQVNFVSEPLGGLGDSGHVLTSAPQGPLLPPLLLEMRMVFGNAAPKVGSARRKGTVRGRSGAGGHRVRVCVEAEAEAEGYGPTHVSTAAAIRAPRRPCVRGQGG